MRGVVFASQTGPHNGTGLGTGNLEWNCDADPNPQPRVVCLLLLLRLRCADNLRQGTWALCLFICSPDWLPRRSASSLLDFVISRFLWCPRLERCNMLKATTGNKERVLGTRGTDFSHG